MRRPEEILKETLKEDNLYPAFLNLHPEWLLKNTLKAIQQAQREAIEETVGRCADKAEMSRFEFYIDSFSETKLRSNHYSINDGLYFKIDDQSILKVSDELKKELGL